MSTIPKPQWLLDLAASGYTPPASLKPVQAVRTPLVCEPLVSPAQAIAKELAAVLGTRSGKKPAKKSRSRRLPATVVEAYVQRALIATHKYEDRMIGDYASEFNSRLVAETIVNERTVSLEAAKSGVTRALQHMFPSRNPGRKDGLPTYRIYREMRSPLLRWFREHVDGEVIAYGTIGELADVELQSRVATDS